MKAKTERVHGKVRGQKEKLVKSIRNMSFIGLAALIIYMVLGRSGAYDRNNFFRYTFGISEALVYVTVVLFPLYTTGLISKFRLRSTNSKLYSIPAPMLKVIGFIVVFAVVALIRLLISKIFG